MRKNRFLLLVLALALSAGVHAREPKRSQAGIEWGGGLTFIDYHRFSYLREDGTRMSGGEPHFLANPNAHLLVRYGWDYRPDWNLSFVTGYEGIYDRVRIVPMTFRASHIIDNQDITIKYWFLEGGLGVDIGFTKFVWLGRAGYGRRFHLSPMTDLDLMLSFRLASFQPDAPDDPDEEPIETIFFNRMKTGTLAATAALNFDWALFKSAARSVRKR